MALYIKDPAVTQLAAQLAAITGESKTEAIRIALEERATRISVASAQRNRRVEMARILGRRVPSMIRAGDRKSSLTLEEVQELLAYSP